MRDLINHNFRNEPEVNDDEVAVFVRGIQLLVYLQLLVCEALSC